MFKKLSSKTVYKNDWMEVFADEVEFPGGHKGEYAYVKRRDGSLVALVNEKNEILLLRQYRYPTNTMEWEIPGGAIDDGESPKDAALRELEEEAGVRVENLDKLSEAYPLGSCSTEKNFIFIARVSDVKLTEADLSDENEYVAEKRFIPLSEALEMIDRGEITDAITSSTIQLVARKLKIS